MADSTLIARTVLGDAETEGFNIVQFNALADWASGGFPGVDAAVSAWEYREPLIFAEIERLGGDIVVMEEIDHFDDVLEPKMGERGYVGHFVRKLNDGRDGCAIFVRSAVAAVSDVESVELINPGLGLHSNSQVGLIVRVKFEGREDTAVVGVLHLKAKEPNEHIRFAQISTFTERLAAFASEGETIFLAGDFNTTPDSTVYSFVSSDTPTEGNIPGEDGNPSPHTMTSPLVFASAYAEVMGHEPEYTTFKKREKEVFRTIDYIFYKSTAVKPVCVWEMPPLESVRESLLPSAAYPSDHFAICAKFVWV